MGTWDKNYFVTELKWDVGEAPWTPQFDNHEGARLLSMDSEVIKNAFYMETAWFFPGDWPKSKGEIGTIKPHTHEFDEIVAWVGSDCEDKYNLNGEVELWIDGKKNLLDRSFLCFIPAGIEHGPIKINRIDKPMFHFTAGMGRKYAK